MAVNKGDLAKTLIDGGLTPQAARVIANALANAGSPQFSQGNDSSDSTPRELLRLITPDARRYQLTNLDYSPSDPFQTRLTSDAAKFDSASDDHPYKDSQPVVSAAPLSSPRVQAGDYITVDNELDGNAQVSKIRLRLRLEPGRHLRLDPSTKSLEGVPLIARTQGKYLAAEFVETEEGTELVISLRGLGYLDDATTLDLLLGNGDTRQAYVFPTAAAVGPASLAAGGTRSLTKKAVRLADGTSQDILTWTDGSASTGAEVTAARCRAYAIFNATRNASNTGASTAGANVHLIAGSNVASVYRYAAGVFKVTLTSALSSANYAITGVGSRTSLAHATMVIRTDDDGTGLTVPQTDKFRVSFVDASNGAEDPTYATVACFL